MSRLCPLPSGIIAIAEINEAINLADPQQTLAALLLPTAKLMAVNAATAKHYHDVLQCTKQLLCQVLCGLFQFQDTAQSFDELMSIIYLQPLMKNEMFEGRC